MGLDLQLLPFDSYPPASDGHINFSHTVLSCDRSPIFEAIATIEKRKGKPVPQRFTTYVSRQTNGEPGYGNTQKDAYGDQIKWVMAKDLAKLAKRVGVKNSTKMRAIWTYLAALDPETPVALYWH